MVLNCKLCPCNYFRVKSLVSLKLEKAGWRFLVVIPTREERSARRLQDALRGVLWGSKPPVRMPCLWLTTASSARAWCLARGGCSLNCMKCFGSILIKGEPSFLDQPQRWNDLSRSLPTVIVFVRMCAEQSLFFSIFSLPLTVTRGCLFSGPPLWVRERH